MGECFLCVLCAPEPVVKDRLFERLNLILFLLKETSDIYSIFSNVKKCGIYYFSATNGNIH